MKELLGKQKQVNIGISKDVWQTLRREVAQGVFNGLLYFCLAMAIGQYIVGFIKGLLK